ncbi:MAG: VWA containing CoxE family protein, partial [Myxococcales bacterium]|nr:VWA containing CoxE family protein [Myxococcales bacterium]
MFLDFFYRLRARGVPVTTHTWLALVEALAKGLHQDTLDGFYQVARCILIQSEAHYDDFDRVFAESFRGVAADARDLLSQIEEWLRDPKLLEHLDP